MGTMTPAELKREREGWYLYDFANSAFFQAAATVRRGAPQPPSTTHRSASYFITLLATRLFFR